MVAVPALIPVTTADKEPTGATRLLLLDHVPEPEASFNVVVPPTQILFVPVITAGVKFTVMLYVAIQPVPNE